MCIKESQSLRVKARVRVHHHCGMGSSLARAVTFLTSANGDHVSILAPPHYRRLRRTCGRALQGHVRALTHHHVGAGRVVEDVGRHWKQSKFCTLIFLDINDSEILKCSVFMHSEQGKFFKFATIDEMALVEEKINFRNAETDEVHSWQSRFWFQYRSGVYSPSFKQQLAVFILFFKLFFIDLLQSGYTSIEEQTTTLLKYTLVSNTLS